MSAVASLSRADVAARLSASPEERAALVREGAQAGVAEAQAVWGQMCLDAGDHRAAFDWFNKAAAQGQAGYDRARTITWDGVIDRLVTAANGA